MQSLLHLRSERTKSLACGLRIPGAFVVVILVALSPASAADMPAIKTGATNPMPECATAGRLQSFLETRNPKLDQRFKSVAAEYQRLGSELGVRWDFAFFQMMLETGQLSFSEGARASGVKASQNNFVGLGATADNTSGESFPDIATGVRAHLEHLLLYSGDKLAAPVAERTRKVQEWGILAQWQKSLTHPVTFSDLVEQWAPKSKTYAHRLEQFSQSFMSGECLRADPQPEVAVLADAQSKNSIEPVAAPGITDDMTSATAVEKLSGAELARRAMAHGSDNKSGLGTGLKSAPPRTDTLDREPAQPVPPSAPAVSAATPSAQKCRVWTASYGGRRAVIVKSVIDQVANYTVLDVNEGQEAREAEAFISAYAKGGAVAGEFTTQDKALEKAFELCPEG